MAVEVERKFRVIGDAWRRGAVGVAYRQGYLSTARERTVRVRIAGDRAFLTVKGLTRGVSRLEFEYSIPLDDAARMLDQLCEPPIVTKTRYRVAADGLTWEIDEFHGDNEGLVVAEVELSRADQSFDRPAWIGEEVSGDPRYFNANLVRHPFRTWS